VRAEVHWIPGPWRGRLGVVARPRGGDWLGDEVQSWRAAGINVVVSLLTHDEAIELQLEEEERRCRDEGMEFLSLPIPDRGIPLAVDPVAELVGTVGHAVESGESVAVHCRQGIGRSALIVASVMAVFGEKPARAFQKIASARGRPVPDTREQTDWVEHFARDLLVASRNRIYGQQSFARETPAQYGSTCSSSADGDTVRATDNAGQQCDGSDTAGQGPEDV
jgi:hypothetical protein